MPRTFTPEEANEALVELRPIVERMVEHRRKLTAAHLHEAADAIQQEAAAISECAERIDAIGAEVKSLEEGLLDFPAMRGDEVVLLCWKLGEDEIHYWHRTGEGFAGRKPLPL
jgi:hypothetical protein